MHLRIISFIIIMKELLKENYKIKILAEQILIKHVQNFGRDFFLWRNLRNLTAKSIKLINYKINFILLTNTNTNMNGGLENKLRCKSDLWDYMTLRRKWPNSFIYWHLLYWVHSKLLLAREKTLQAWLPSRYFVGSQESLVLRWY